MSIFEQNLNKIRRWRGEVNNYICKLSMATGGYDELKLNFDIITKDYIPINKYGNYVEPYNKFSLTIPHLDKYSSKEIEELLNEINKMFKKYVCM